jgi:hypothetical protein
MLKKIGYFYLVVVTLALLLAIASKLASSGTDIEFGLEVLVTLLFVFLFYTSPIWLLALLLIAFGKPLKQFFTQAERFHAGDK